MQVLVDLLGDATHKQVSYIYVTPLVHSHGVFWSGRPSPLVEANLKPPVLLGSLTTKELAQDVLVDCSV
jgi:hypothetical protein